MEGLDDLLGGGKPAAPSRPRFQPKNTKLKPQQPKPKMKVDTELPDQQQQGIGNISVNGNTAKNELHDLKPKPQSPPLEAATGDDSVKMEIDDVKIEEKKDGIVEEDEIEEENKVDRVVREIDVYFKPTIDPDTQLYVFQYPLRQSWRPYEMDERCQEVRVRSSKLGVEIDLSTNTDSKTYDDSSIEAMSTQTLTSTMTNSEETGAANAIGLLIGNKLCIYPVHAVVQMRPSFENLDSGSKKVNAASTSAEGAKKAEDIKDENSDWIAHKYLGARSDESSHYLRKMASHEASPIQFSMSPGEYIDALCPPAVNNNSNPKGPSKRDFLSLPLEERYKKWLIEAPQINRFVTLKHLAPNETDEEVLQVLRKYSLLVHGLWVTKTSLLYYNDTQSVAKSLARDLVLVLFRKSIVIGYEQIRAAGPLGKFMNDALADLATDRPSLKDWKFKETPDHSFVKRYANVVKEQDRYWEEVEKKVMTNAQKKGVQLGPKVSAKSSADKPEAAMSPIKNMPNNTAKMASKMTMSYETREALPKALHKLFQTHRHCSFQQICQRLREMAVSESTRPKGTAKEAIAAAYAVDAPRSELVEMIEQIAIDIHGVYVPKTSYDHPQYDPFRNVVIGLLIVEGPNAKLRKGTITETAKLKLGRDIAPSEYQAVMNELCTSSGPIWVLKNSGGSSK